MATKKKAPAKAKKATPAKKTAAAVTGLYGEVSKSTGIEAKAKETAGDYAVRACQAISELTDDKFGALPKPVQDWFDKSVEAINAEKPGDIPAISGFPTAAGTKADGGTKPKKAAKKQATLPGVAKGGKARVDSVAYRMRLQVVKNIDVDFDDACKGAKLKAERGSNAWNAYFNAVQTMRIARAEGLVK